MPDDAPHASEPDPADDPPLRPLDRSLAEVLRHPGWRARLDDLLGGSVAHPGRLLGVLIVVGVAVWALSAGRPGGEALDLPVVVPAVAPGSGAAPAPAPPSPVGTASPTMAVHAAGAVVAPGVVVVPAGSRVVDVLAAAGGPSADADLDRLNLAAPATDGGQVRVPRRGEEIAPPPVGGAPATGGPSASAITPGAGPVSLSSATAADLEALPGIGPATAAAIIEHRDRHGGFGSVDELLEVRGVGEARLEQLRPLVVP